MPMQPKTKLVNVLLTNIPIAICISFVASYIGVSGAGVPQEAFVPTLMRSVGMNILMSYVISFFVGMFVPAPKWGMAFAAKFGVTPRDGVKFGLLMSVVVNTVYVIANSVILTYVNAIVLGGAPMAAYLPALLGSFVPCWLVGFVVSFFWAPAAEKIARNICNDPAPRM
ncbi:MAG: hypothetical protein IKG18_12495 [Atopobiaceae bacterium]|nr:hypothetical protein [Atopobiaceae bacterium]MBR3314945.1 hypothetical protein [Atopobiaceae bacterium]